MSVLLTEWPKLRRKSMDLSINTISNSTFLLVPIYSVKMYTPVLPTSQNFICLSALDSLPTFSIKISLIIQTEMNSSRSELPRNFFGVYSFQKSIIYCLEAVKKEPMTWDLFYSKTTAQTWPVSYCTGTLAICQLWFKTSYTHYFI